MKKKKPIKDSNKHKGSSNKSSDIIIEAPITESGMENDDDGGGIPPAPPPD